MKKHMVCLTLILCLLLTACGGAKDTHQGQVSLSEEKATVEVEDILLTVDGREVAAWQYLYWLRRSCETIAGEYETANTELDWSEQTKNGTLADYAKAQALSDTALYATVENWAEQYGCVEPVTIGTAEDGVTAQQNGKLAQVGRLYAKLYALFFEQGSTLYPSDEEVMAFAKEEGWVGVRQVRIPFGEDREAARSRAAEIFGRLNAAAVAETEFSAIEGVERSGIRTLRLGDGILPLELEDALSGLEEGQFSGILESEDAFVLLLRQQADELPVREALFDHLLLEAATKAEIRCTAAYKALDVASFWQSVDREEKLET